MSRPSIRLYWLFPLALVACAGLTFASASPVLQHTAMVTALSAEVSFGTTLEQVAPSMRPPPQKRPPAPPEVTDQARSRAERIEAFIEYAATTYALDPDEVRVTLSKAQMQPRIIEIMNRPAEAVRQWSDYRSIFINSARISRGVAFYRQHRNTLERIADETGVPAEYIVAILGVETSYGRITGHYRVLDALYTLAFDYPKRAPFFAAELAHLFALIKAEPQLDFLTLKGSYAGAMGLGQFMPSSYRLWARDGDGDGQRDLLGNLPDVFASIAHYFVVHGWERDMPVVARAHRSDTAQAFEPDTPEPVYRLDELAALGYTPLSGEPRTEPATLLTLAGDEGAEHWMTYHNFYVITRYNRSPMYALSVHQLAQAIRTGAN